MLYMEDDYRFEKYPFLGRPDTFTPEKARELVPYARQHHIELVPQIESLGHASALLSHPELADLRLGDRSSAICPSAEGTFPFLNDLYGELCAAFPQSALFHVGADEVWEFNVDPRCTAMIEEKGQEGVYAFHLNNLQKLLAKRGRKMAFWGDEVLKHPKVADMLARDIVVFDWHYGDQQSYPSVQFFQDRGFKEIFVCPAVRGSFDVYPFYRNSFGNIRGFTRTGVERGVDGVCCTTWGMNRGGNAENYLYGLAYAAECAWSSKEADRAFFDECFAAVWLGIADAKGVGEDMDRAFWFAWRGPAQGAFWQRRHEVSEIFFGGYDTFAEKLDDDARGRLAEEAAALETYCADAVAAIERLRKKAARNLETLRALEHAVRAHRYVAAKCLAMCELADRYRAAYCDAPEDRRSFEGILDSAVGRLRRLKEMLPSLEAGLQEGIEKRDGDPNDMAMFRSARDALNGYLKRLVDTKTRIAAGEKPPDPAALGLGQRVVAKIWEWGTSDINPSDRENPRKIVVEVTKWVTSAGQYEVEWDYVRGADGINILNTGLYRSSSRAKVPDDLAAVSVDDHEGFTGGADRKNRYKLVVQDCARGYRHFVIGLVYDQRDLDTKGVVWLRRYWSD